MFKMVSVALVAAFFMSAVPIPSHAQQCVTPQQMVEGYEDSPIVLRVQLRDGAAQVFASYYNAIPPETNYKPDLVQVWAAPGETRYQMILFEDGCAVAGEILPIPLVEGWLKKLANARI